MFSVKDQKLKREKYGNSQAFPTIRAIGSYGYETLCVEAFKNYKKNRENGADCDSPREKFPNDGKFIIDGQVAGKHVVRYQAGKYDEEWMNKKDITYLTRMEIEQLRIDVEKTKLEETKLEHEIKLKRLQLEKESLDKDGIKSPVFSPRFFEKPKQSESVLSASSPKNKDKSENSSDEEIKEDEETPQLKELKY